MTQYQEFIQNVEQYYIAKKARVESQCREYLTNSKDRKNYYHISGYSCLGDDSIECDTYLAYTDEQIQRIQELIITTFNAYFEAQVQTLSEMYDVEKDFELLDIEGQCEELDNLVFAPSFERGVRPATFNFDRVYHLYTFSCLGYDIKHAEIVPLRNFRIRLTDEEYIYLMTEESMKRGTFCFNDLIKSNGKLARKINDYAQGSYFTLGIIAPIPYLIILNEVRQDVCELFGPETETRQLYEVFGEKVMSHFSAHTEGRELAVCQETARHDANVIHSEQISDIDADRVMTLLGATDYSSMLDKMKELYGTPDGYKRFREFLDANHISYTVEPPVEG